MHTIYICTTAEVTGMTPMESDAGNHDTGYHLNLMRRQVVQCTRCGLSRTRTNAVPGKGDPRADVMFVGEAPGRSEDRYGEPFVGMAGRRLNEALEKAGIARGSTYITNVVKCRPPDNRVPNDAEKAACSVFLEEEIHLINPRMICILGNTALASVLGRSGIMKYRGKTVRKNGMLYFITIHPAATIYRQELSDTLNADIGRMFHMIQGMKIGGTIRADIEHDA